MTVTAAWIALVVCAIIAGASVVAVMVVRPSLEPLSAVVGVSALGASVFALIALTTSYRSNEVALWAFAFLVAGAGGGYALTSTLLHVLARLPRTPALTTTPPPGTERPAVIVVACTEPEFYDPWATAQMLQALADEGLLDASIGFLPFLFFAQKTRYRAIGGSNPAHSQLRSVAEKLGTALADTDVSIALCSGTQSLDRQVLRAVNGGSSTVVLAQLTVGESSSLAAAKEGVRNLRLEAHGVRLASTAPLTCSDRITGMLAAQIISSTVDPATTGVVLVGHGQPDEIAAVHPQMDEDEAVFLSRLKIAVLEGGVPAANVRIAWADWGEPEVTSTVRHLVALGCTRVIVQPSTYPLDTIGTRLDLEMAVRQARTTEEATVITLPAWKDDPAVIAELRKNVVESLDSVRTGR